jgi:hypothetical protein
VASLTGAQRQQTYRAKNKAKVNAYARAYAVGYRQSARDRIQKQSKAYSEKRAEWFANYKLLRGCVDCGYHGHSAALDFDHVKGKKEYNLSQMRKSAMSNIMAEINKCEIVCANCHRIRTFNRIQR